MVRRSSARLRGQFDTQFSVQDMFMLCIVIYIPYLGNRTLYDYVGVGKSNKSCLSIELGFCTLWFLFVSVFGIDQPRLAPAFAPFSLLAFPCDPTLPGAV